MYQQSIALDAKGSFTDELPALDAAAGYYASSILAGEETTARSWLFAHGAAAGVRWLETKSSELRRLIAVERVALSQSRQLGE